MAYVSMVGLECALRARMLLDDSAVVRHSQALAASLLERIAPLGWLPFRAQGPDAAPHIVAIGHSAIASDDAVARLRREGVVCSSRNNRLRLTKQPFSQRRDHKYLRYHPSNGETYPRSQEQYPIHEKRQPLDSLL